MKTPEHIYRPSCARCRDEAGKDRAGVLDTSLCNWHTNDLVLTLRAEHERLREALRYYADPQTYGLNGGLWNRIAEDAGRKARAALKEVPRV